MLTKICCNSCRILHSRY